MDNGQDSLDGILDCSPAENLRHRITFDVADVEPCIAPMPEVPHRSAIDAAIVATSYASLSDGPTPIEACSDAGSRLIPAIGSHPVVEAVHLAYANHMPLTTPCATAGSF